MRFFKVYTSCLSKAFTVLMFELNSMLLIAPNNEDSPVNRLRSGEISLEGGGSITELTVLEDKNSWLLLLLV